MTELEVAAFRRDCAALAGHVRAGLRGDGFGETARQALDKLVTLAYGAAGMGEEAACRPGAISALSGRVYTDGADVVLCTGAGDDHEWATTMAPDAAEEMAHALLLCAAAARGRGVYEQDKAIVARWVLR